ncbi:hypothetical protein BX600DRAFT_468677 [Xylariales sp. PMI_506]|nr:hypothetical protein BX600DRAFT_468677 [Xylariales sp. PMI_506]
MWFRIVYYERLICLMLGFPQGSIDRSMGSTEMLTTDTPLGRLERIHCVLASFILERNEADPRSHSFYHVQSIENELQMAARGLPSKWWLTPNLGSTNNAMELFWDTRRLFSHLFHYNLLNQLHLPYMLRSSTDPKYAYSRVTCVTASRELLARFIMLRSFNRITHSCRTVDFLALMAAMTLILAHLDSHRARSSLGKQPQVPFHEQFNLLAPQYLSDRAMIEQALENMEELGRANDDALSSQSAQLLRRLLAIESEAAEGDIRRAASVSVQVSGGRMAETSGEDGTSSYNRDDNSVRVLIPYFGVIKIAREGVITREIPIPREDFGLGGEATAKSTQDSPISSIPSLLTSVRDHAEGTRRFTGLASQHGGLNDPPEVNYRSHIDGHSPPSSDPRTPKAVHPETGVIQLQSTDLERFDDLQRSSNNSGRPHVFSEQFNYPVLNAGTDDWAFQGVDMAFFENLMRGARN